MEIITNQTYVKNNFFSKVKEALNKIPFMNEVIALYYCATDSKTPLLIKIELFSALAYFILPIDIIPDILPGGFADDIGVLIGAINLANNYITKEHKERAKQYLMNEL